MLAPRPGQPGYQQSPEVESIQIRSLGGIVSAHHAEPVPAEWLGRSEGPPGQCFTVRKAPVLPRTTPAVRCGS